MSDHVTICEMSPRDGMQSVNRDRRIPIEMRLCLIDALKRAKFPYIEAASFVSPKVFPQFADSVEVLTRSGPYDGQLAALVPNFKYYEQFKSTPNLNCVAVFLSASDEYSRKNKRISLEDDLVDANQIAAAAKANGHFLRAHLSGAFRDLTAENRETDPNDVARVCRELIAMGCELVALADTDGRATTGDVQRIIAHLCSSNIDIAKIGVHLHDRDDNAIENALEAFRLGVRTFDSAVGGIGGNRASADYVGNIATDLLIAQLMRLGVQTGIDSDALRESHGIVDQMTQLAGDPRPAAFCL
ncbi:hydroxymethylglutaryl-CoA lyase [soil metagenome]